MFIRSFLAYLWAIYLIVISGYSAFLWGNVGEVCRKPKEEDKNKNTFCFFSLNNPKEQTHFQKLYKNIPNVEVKEFYGTGQKGQSVQTRFKKMLKDEECDCLIISGHHLGFFSGEQSTADKNLDWSLDLDFMEDLSCEEGCEDWFSNVKCLFLMGCQTVEPVKMRDQSKASADSETIRVISHEMEEFAKFSELHQRFNQAYSSTLDQNNKLSHRYLRMFPESSLYGWGATSPGKKAGSYNSLPNFIKLVQDLQEPDKSKSSPENDILQFIDFMNHSDNTCHKYANVAGRWALHWNKKASGQEVGAQAKATACFLDPISDIKERFKGHQQRGCDLTRALKGNNSTGVKNAVQNILNSGKEGVRANFNRLMSLVTNKKNHKKDWYDGVIEKLKNSSDLQTAVVEGIESSKTGFVRKSDYLYFYDTVGWAGEDKNRDKKLSQLFLTQLSEAFDNIGSPQSADKATGSNVSSVVQNAHHQAIFESVAQNKLGNWLSRVDKSEFKKLQNKFMNSTINADKLFGYSFNYLRHDSTEQDIHSSDWVLQDYLQQLKDINYEYREDFRQMFCRYRENISSSCPFK